MFFKTINKDSPVIAWWSGGVTSAVTCWLCIQWFGVENVRVIFIDTFNESDDTYRFKKECENWYGCSIETIYSLKFKSIREVWFTYLSLNVATGAICSYHLKKLVREEFQKTNNFSYQAFGFDVSEINRAKGMKLNNPSANPFFPLINELLSKIDCIKIIEKANDLFLQIQLPETYKKGYLNNNCDKTGCVQGGIGYWQKIQRDEPLKFDAMALVEHELTDQKGEPVTMLKDQGKNGGLVFLKPHPNYPKIKDISMMKGREPKPLIDCNGFCGSNDFKRNLTDDEINFDINVA